MEIWRGPSPFPFPFSSRLRPSRLSRRSQDVLKSGILLLMDSKHHKKFIRKRRIVKVPGRALGRVGRREERGRSFVFVYAQYLNKPALFFTRCSETFLHSTPPLGFERTREPWRRAAEPVPCLTIRKATKKTKCGISQIWQLVPFQTAESDPQTWTASFLCPSSLTLAPLLASRCWMHPVISFLHLAWKRLRQIRWFFQCDFKFGKGTDKKKPLNNNKETYTQLLLEKPFWQHHHRPRREEVEEHLSFLSRGFTYLFVFFIHVLSRKYINTNANCVFFIQPTSHRRQLSCKRENIFVAVCSPEACRENHVSVQARQIIFHP